MKGKRIIITRAEDRAESLVSSIRAAGGLPIVVQVIDILDPQDSGSLFDVLGSLHNFDIAIFVSPNAVNKTQAHWPVNYKQSGSIKILAIGPGTQERLEYYGLKVDSRPLEDFSTEGLLRLSILQKEKINGKKVAIFCGENNRLDLGQILKERGAKVTPAYVYRRCCPGLSASLDLRGQLRGWQEEGISLVVGTSVESVYNLLKMAGEQGALWLKQLPWLMVSQRIVDRTKVLGFAIRPIIANNASNQAIFQALIDVFSG